MKKNIKGFTLIELLVVVAIIGILAAVGVVAYNGYTKAAKINATKSIHNNVMKFIAAETKKCSLDSSGTILKNADGTGGLTCTALNTAVINTTPTGASSVTTTIGALGAVISDKNPHTPKTAAGLVNYAVGCSDAAGCVTLTADENVVTIVTTTGSETLTNTVEVE